jgi:hypothetical protein
MRLDHILQSLAVIGKLEEGQKFSCRYGLLSIDRKPSPFMRWLGGDDRKTTLMYISNVVNEALLNGHTEELLQAVPGLGSLRVTYSSDAATVAAIDILIKKCQHTTTR